MTGTKKIDRNLESTVRSRLQQFPAVALIGARQVGKMELAKTIGSQWKYVDLENPHSVIFDEAQDYPQLFVERLTRQVIQLPVVLL